MVFNSSFGGVSATIELSRYLFPVVKRAVCALPPGQESNGLTRIGTGTPGAWASRQ